MADLCQKYAAKFFVEIEYITTENKILTHHRKHNRRLQLSYRWFADADCRDEI